jgi:hypothetical protein
MQQHPTQQGSEDQDNRSKHQASNQISFQNVKVIFHVIMRNAKKNIISPVAHVQCSNVAK